VEILELRTNKQIKILGVFGEKIDPSIDPAGFSLMERWLALWAWVWRGDESF
jgi:hypothetical protein